MVNRQNHSGRQVVDNDSKKKHRFSDCSRRAPDVTAPLEECFFHVTPTFGYLGKIYQFVCMVGLWGKGGLFSFWTEQDLRRLFSLV